jgi:hypothetical protein
MEITIDATELEGDIQRLQDGEIELPTVSALRITSEGIFDEELVLWLSDESRCPMQ